MIPVPYSVMKDYVAILASREIPPAHIEYYKKWLRYYYDFSGTCPGMNDKPEMVRLFLEKLRSRNQSAMQCQQAAHAISLYFEMQSQAIQVVTSVDEPSKEQNVVPDQMSSHGIYSESPAQTAHFPAFKQHQSQYSEVGYQEKSDSLEWDNVLEAMATEIKVRHYSRRTLQTYANWSRNFQRFLKNKLPETLTTDRMSKSISGFWLSKAKSQRQLKTRHLTRFFFSLGTD
jgi:hypothetical protein